MITSLKGIIQKGIDNQITVEVNGVGYGLFVSLIDLESLENNQEASFFIYEYIREQSYDLYGFLELSSKELFIRLLEVNGVGPKAALAILNLGPIDQLVQAIQKGNSLYIQRASGVGKRVADRILIDLKDKVSSNHYQPSNHDLVFKNNNDDAINALVSMGYNKKEAIIMLSDIETDLPTIERVRLALKRK